MLTVINVTCYFQVNITSCQYLVDVDLPTEAAFEPRYSQNTKDWQVLISTKFLDNAKSVHLHCLILR